MINKYWLYKQVLTNDVCTGELKPEKTQLDEMFNLEEPSEDVVYKQRVAQIDYHILSCIGNVNALTGGEVKALISQRDDILYALNGQWDSVKLALEANHTFKEALESQFNVTLEHIYDYDKAEKLLSGKREVVICLDNNNTKFVVDGQEKMLHTNVIDNQITIEKCREIVDRIAKYNCYPQKLSIDLSIYTDTEGNDYGDCPEECLLNRKATYNVEQDKLMIWEKGNPVYENNHGVICNDPITLADCYM